MGREAWPGHPFPLGATWEGNGTNFSLFSEHATRVRLCLFDDEGREEQIDIEQRTAFHWHCYLPGVGPVVAARVLADVGDVTRFADRNRFASWTGTAPLDASSGEQNRHRLSRAGNRRMNHMIHIAAATQIRLDTPGRAYYRRKLAAGKTRAEAMRCLKRRLSDAL